MKEETKKLIENILNYVLVVIMLLAIPISVGLVYNNEQRHLQDQIDLMWELSDLRADTAKEWAEAETAYEFVERIHEMEIEHLTEMYEARTQTGRVYIKVENDGDFELIWKDDGGWNYLQTLGGIVVEERCFGFVDKQFIDGFLGGRLLTFYEIP